MSSRAADATSSLRGYFDNPTRNANTGDDPPPAFPTEVSETLNALPEEARKGHEWCNKIGNELRIPRALLSADLAARNRYDYRLEKPEANFYGELIRVREGVWRCKRGKKSVLGRLDWRRHLGRDDVESDDTCITAEPPMYAANHDMPKEKGQQKTIYYEVHILNNQAKSDDGDSVVPVAIGYTALPYPTTFRLPGWHRGSLAVHGDDGRKYVNNSGGGEKFAEPMKQGQRYGIGMTFTANKTGEGLDVKVFYTQAGSVWEWWDLHEARDSALGPVTGLAGFHDLCAAIGTYGVVDFEVIFDQKLWLYTPPGLSKKGV